MVGEQNKLSIQKSNFLQEFIRTKVGIMSVGHLDFPTEKKLVQNVKYRKPSISTSKISRYRSKQQNNFHHTEISSLLEESISCMGRIILKRFNLSQLPVRSCIQNQFHSRQALRERQLYRLFNFFSCHTKTAFMEIFNITSVKTYFQLLMDSPAKTITMKKSLRHLKNTELFMSYNKIQESATETTSKTCLEIIFMKWSTFFPFHSKKQGHKTIRSGKQYNYFQMCIFQY